MTLWHMTRLQTSGKSDQSAHPKGRKIKSLCVNVLFVGFFHRLKINGYFRLSFIVQLKWLKQMGGHHLGLAVSGQTITLFLYWRILNPESCGILELNQISCSASCKFCLFMMRDRFKEKGCHVMGDKPFKFFLHPF